MEMYIFYTSLKETCSHIIFFIGHFVESFFCYVLHTKKVPKTLEGVCWTMFVPTGGGPERIPV